MPDWTITPGLTPYPEALAAMESRVDAIVAGEADELVWLLEHPPLYTGGTSADPADLLEPERFPVFPTRRGGEYTYHGPGQRVAYAMLDLNRRGRDIRTYVHDLEEWAIRTVGDFGVTAERRAGRVGVWVARPDKPPLPDGSPAEDKIAAIGVRVSSGWITSHGFALNVATDLSYFETIVPCGIGDRAVTSLAVELGRTVEVTEVESVTVEALARRLGRSLVA